MIIRITIKGRIRDHHRRIPCLPVAQMIREIHSGDQPRGVDRVDGQAGRLGHRFFDPADEHSITYLANHQDEVTFCRIEERKSWTGKLLAVTSIAEVSNHLKAKHYPHDRALSLQRFRMDGAPHLL